MQRLVDSALAVAKESVKAFTQESFNNAVRLINGISALVLAVLPGKAGILEGIQGWELRPSFQAPRLPRWMEDGVSSFNQFIHDFSADSDSCTESEHGSGQEENDESTVPSSPSTQASHLSRASSFSRHEKHQKSMLKHFIGWILFPIKYILGISQSSHNSSRSSTRLGGSLFSSPSSTGSFRRMYGIASRRVNGVKDHIVHRTTDRRRGVIEDLQLVVEIIIEAAFDFVHKVLHYFLSPLETCRLVFRRLCMSQRVSKSNDSVGDKAVSVQTSILGNLDPTPTVQQTKFQQSLNTDARTCEDVITELGYPYEAIRVITADGYVLLLERIPRRDSQKVLYLQHGLLDSSLGWVSNGVVGSQAFAAYDQGYDVFLGNFRGLVSREHIDKHISSRRYWRYSINEHGTQDIPAMIEKMHELKMSELGYLQVDSEPSNEIRGCPYTVCAVSHSLGGAAMLMYVVTRRLEGKPHRLSRLILLSPAGLHEDAAIVFKFFEYFIRIFAPILCPLIPGLYIPTKFFRMLLNKLARDFQNYPALGGLVQTLFSYVVGGDSSNWVGAIGQPHYNMNDMPGVSYRVAVHLAQMKQAKKFIMYDFGSSSANMEAYGTPYPIDIGENYGVIDIPVDVVAGKKDRLIPRSNVMKHYRLMKDAGVEVSYEEFEYAHLDFTFSHREELLTYVMSRLLLVSSLTGEKQSRKSGYSRQKYHMSKDGRKSRKSLSRKPDGKKEKIPLDDRWPEEPKSPISGCSSSSEGSLRSGIGKSMKEDHLTEEKGFQEYFEKDMQTKKHLMSEGMLHDRFVQEIHEE
eukprot:Gb_31536 [translate_table: standard]